VNLADSIWQSAKPQMRDALWVLLFLALHFSSPIVNPAEVELLVAAGLFELCEPRIDFFREKRAGRIASVLVRLVIAYLLIGVTGGITSSYYLILLLPVVTAATLFEALGTFSLTALAGAGYLSFLLFLDFDRYIVPPDQQQEITFRILFLFVAAFLTYQLARNNREAVSRYQTLAGELQAANRNLVAAQADAQRSERLAALGQLTAGLAHELRNPLGTIRTSAEMLAKRVGAVDPLAQELTGYISSEVDRTNELVKRFLDFAKPFRLQVSAVDLRDVVDRAIRQVRTRAENKRVTIYRQDAPELAEAPLDAQWIEQMLANLLANAIDASPEDAVVTVVLREAEGGVELAVSDRGAGIPEENRQVIFNPFFTTKAEGTGLGLAIVSKIVDEHHGRIFVESKPGEGATFRVWLPRRAESE
jgi:two-component system, NtrC family, sensor histidine kinase HydH